MSISTRRCKALVFATENRIAMNEVAPGCYGFQATQFWDAPSGRGTKAILSAIFSLAFRPELDGAEGHRQNKIHAELEKHRSEGAIKLLARQ
jgi:hypothetical protein